MSHLPVHTAFAEAAQQSAIAVNVALEHDLLGMALNEPELAANSAVTAQHFCDFINGMVWDALREGGSLAVVASRLNYISAFHQLRGIDFLSDLVNKAPMGHLWAQTEARLFEAWRLRRVVELSEGLAFDIEFGAGSAAAITRFRAELDTLQSVGPASSRFETVNFHDIAPSPQPWLIKGALPMRGVGFIGGATKAGKSFLALDITLRLAAGAHKILGRTAKPCGAVYIAAEDPEGCKYRVKAWENRHHRANLERSSHMPFDLIPQSVNLLDEACVCDLKRALKSAHARFEARGSRLGVIVIDTLSRCLGGADENSSADMGRAFDVLADIARDIDALVLVVAHFGKAGADRGLRGHSLLDANSEATITVERATDDPDLRLVTLAKVKNGVDGQQLAFRLEPVGLGLFDEDGEEIGSCVPVFEAASSPKTRQGRALKAPEQMVLNAIRYVTDHEATQSLPVTVEGGKPWMKAVTREQVRARAYATGLAGEESANTARMRFSRALEGLCAVGKVRIERDLVWLV